MARTTLGTSRSSHTTVAAVIAPDHRDAARLRSRSRDDRFVPAEAGSIASSEHRSRPVHLLRRRRPHPQVALRRAVNSQSIALASHRGSWTSVRLGLERLEFPEVTHVRHAKRTESRSACSAATGSSGRPVSTTSVVSPPGINLWTRCARSPSDGQPHCSGRDRAWMRLIGLERVCRAPAIRSPTPSRKMSLPGDFVCQRFQLLADRIVSDGVLGHRGIGRLRNVLLDDHCVCVRQRSCAPRPTLSLVTKLR